MPKRAAANPAGTADIPVRPRRRPVLAALGQNVRRRREERALTQEKLAEKAGLDPMPLAQRMGEGGRQAG